MKTVHLTIELKLTTVENVQKKIAKVQLKAKDPDQKMTKAKR